MFACIARVECRHAWPLGTVALSAFKCTLPITCAADFNINIDTVSLLVDLVVTVLVPSLAGKVGRWHSGACGIGSKGDRTRSPWCRCLGTPEHSCTCMWCHGSCVLQALRDLCPPVRRFVTKYKTALSLFSTANLAFIVWQVLSSAQHESEIFWRCCVRSRCAAHAPLPGACPNQRSCRSQSHAACPPVQS